MPPTKCPDPYHYSSPKEGWMVVRVTEDRDPNANEASLMTKISTATLWIPSLKTPRSPCGTPERNPKPMSTPIRMLLRLLMMNQAHKLPYMSSWTHLQLPHVPVESAVSLSTTESISSVSHRLSLELMERVHWYLQARITQHPDTTVVIPAFVLDNRAAQSGGHPFRNSEHTRHIARRWHYVRSQVSGRFAVLPWVPTDFQLSDSILIKAIEGRVPTYVLFCAICEEVPRHRSLGRFAPALLTATS
jgi:hypothetical protein